MNGIDNKILKELQLLPEELKKHVLQFIKQIRSTSTDIKQKHSVKSPGKKKKITSEPGYGGAKDLLEYVPENLDQISVAEDFEEYT